MNALRASQILFAFALVIALVRAIHFRWVMDDAFISFRYAQNFARGHGLVFNVGEKVEGYTNFLWTVVISGGMRLGIDPIVLAATLGILGYLGTIVVLGAVSRRLGRDAVRSSLPFAALACALHHDLQVWATGGLETAWVTLAVTSGTVLLALARTLRACAIAGLVLVLGIFLRPDAIIAFGCGAAFLLIAGPRQARAIFSYFLPFLVLFLPYWFLKAAYYGHFYPNTYYAKSADLAYYAQGFKYAALYAITYPSFLILLVAAAISGIVLGGRARNGLQATTERILLLSVLVALSWTMHVIRVGGDFMFARLFIPITPLAFLAGESALLRFVAAPRTRLAAGLLLALSVLFRPDVFAKETFPFGISDEHLRHPDPQVRQARRSGERMREILHGTSVAVAFYGGYAMHAFYSEVDPAIEASTGLTDEYIAHQPLAKRGRMGHEKRAPLDYLARRNVRIAFRGPPGSGNAREVLGSTAGFPREILRLKLGGYAATIVSYDNDLMEKLKRFDDVAFIDFPQYLDQYLGRIDGIPTEQVMRDYEFLRRFYFDVNDDREREEKFLARIRASSWMRPGCAAHSGMSRSTAGASERAELLDQIPGKARFALGICTKAFPRDFKRVTE